METPLLVTHGLEDELLSWQSVEYYYEWLNNNKPNVEINTIANMSH